jgi:hypothetical protein
MSKEYLNDLYKLIQLQEFIINNIFNNDSDVDIDFDFLKKTNEDIKFKIKQYL